MSKGNIYLVAGASGSAKTALTDQLCRANLGVSRVVTVTTREPRLGETDGRDYYFVSPLTFDRMRGSGQFIESVTIYKESYGTPLGAFDGENDLVAIVSTTGALFLSEFLGDDAHTVFIQPPGPLVAAERVHRRQAQHATQRVDCYEEEIAHAEEFETIILNDDLDRALVELSNLILERRFDRWKIHRAGLTSEVTASA